MSGPFLPCELDDRLDTAHRNYLAAVWRTDLTVAEQWWLEIERLRADRDRPTLHRTA